MKTKHLTPKNLGLAVATVGLAGCLSYPHEHMMVNSMCKHDGGEHISKTVDNVEYVFQMRVPNKLSGVVRAPNYVDGKWAGDPTYWAPFDHFVLTREYPRNFISDTKRLPNKEYALTGYVFEAIATGDDAKKGRYIRIRTHFELSRPCSTYYCYADGKMVTQIEHTDELRSTYGYSWRDLEGLPSRFSGGELSIVNLKTGEVLAYSRSYALAPAVVPGKSGGGTACSVELVGNAMHPNKLLAKVLRPNSVPMKRLYE